MDFTVQTSGKTTATVRRRKDKFVCPVCVSPSITATRVYDRLVQGVPFGKHRFFLRVKMHRIRSHKCGAYQMERLTFLPSTHARCTRALSRTIIELRSEMSISAIADYFRLHWITVKDIEKNHLEIKYKHIPLKDVEIIGIDEIHIGNMKFFTIVRDLTSGAVLHLGKGKGADSLQAFSRRLKISGCQIDAVTVDFFSAYTAWIKEVLPDTMIIYDHFHLIKLINDKLNTIRRHTMAQLEEEQKKSLKNKRWLFLKNIETLDDNDTIELNQLRNVYKDLGDASMLKESLRNIYSLAPDIYTARTAFEKWCDLAIETGIKELKTMAKTIRNHLEGILAHWYLNISNASMEGFNNKIRWLVRQAYGYHDREYFRLKIFDLPKLKTVK
jgi:transposase